MYKLLYHPQAVKQLKQLHPTDRERINNKLKLVSENPRDPSLNIKKLVNTESSYRLRSGDIRAIFEVDSPNKTIYIWNIDYRGSIY